MAYIFISNWSTTKVTYSVAPWAKVCYIVVCYIACAGTSGLRSFASSSLLHYLLWTSARSVYFGLDVNILNTAIKILSLTVKLFVSWCYSIWSCNEWWHQIVPNSSSRLEPFRRRWKHWIWAASHHPIPFPYSLLSRPIARIKLLSSQLPFLLGSRNGQLEACQVTTL